MQLYYITNRKFFPGDETSRRTQLLDKISEAARAGVDYIQLREKDLSTRDLETLAREALRIVREIPTTTKLLLNSCADIAIAVGADGVHLRSDDLSPREVAAIRALVQAPGAARFITAVSCHSPDDVRRAELEGADFAVLAPIFGKGTDPSAPSLGLEPLRTASQRKLPVLALGGVTLENAEACTEAGAVGIAAIRVFQNGNIPELVRRLRSRN